jgi:ATP-binding cassette, subfamily B, multidrug efflux pump
VESFSSVEFDRFSTASLITRSTNDVTQVQMVIFMIMRMVFFAPIIGVGGVIRAIDKSAAMWWIIAVAVVALLSLILVVFWIALPKFKHHPEPDRPAQPGDPREPLGHDGHPRL